MSSQHPTIRFHLEYSFTLSARRKLKAAIRELFTTEGKALCSLDYIFCSDEYLLQINKDFLQHDTLTDVITFDMSDQPGCITGEIYISIERVTDNARRFQVPRFMELKRVMFHGALHLCGYADKKRSDKQLMTQKENFYLDRST